MVSFIIFDSSNPAFLVLKNRLPNPLSKLFNGLSAKVILFFIMPIVFSKDSFFALSTGIPFLISITALLIAAKLDCCSFHNFSMSPLNISICSFNLLALSINLVRILFFCVPISKLVFNLRLFGISAGISISPHTS